MIILRADSTNTWPLRDGSVSVIVTSPAYWGLRSYGDDYRELGRESLEAYLKDWGVVAQEARRVIQPDGLMWLNCGDSASRSGGAGGDYNQGGSKEGRPRWRQGDSGLPPKTLCNVPGRLTEVMLAQGWRLRSHIVWDKDRVRPESLAHVKRPLIQWEPILMFSPGTHHRFYPEGLVERGNVWRFPPNATGDKGQAPFPDELARRCILPSTREGEVVLDPFCGSGTTMRVAEELGRRGVGLDLYA